MQKLWGKTAAFILACLIGSHAEVIFFADFNTDTDRFHYIDDVFRGTSQPGYAAGLHEFAGLSVNVGGVDAAIVENMSGAWEVGFNVPSAGAVELKFDYNLSAAPDYESNEYSEILVAIDGQLRGLNGNDYVVRIYDGGVENMLEAVVSLGHLSAGSHRLSIGTYNNRKSEQAEETSLWFDNVVVNLEPNPDPDPPTTCEGLPSDPNDPYARIPISRDFVIGDCGSYYLTQNAPVIVIETSNVTLDLNGHAVEDAIYVDNHTVKIYNGSTKGIFIRGNRVSIDHVKITNGNGIIVQGGLSGDPNTQGGRSFKITNSVISNNDHGIKVIEPFSVSGVIKNNIIEYNQGYGIEAYENSYLLIQNNVISFNKQQGIHFSGLADALILQNLVTKNALGHITAPSATLIENVAKD